MMRANPQLRRKDMREAIPGDKRFGPADGSHKKDHPMYNTAQNPKQKLSSQLNWLAFQFGAARSNLGNAVAQISRDKREWLSYSARCDLADLEVRVATAIAELASLEVQVKEFNKLKGKL